MKKYIIMLSILLFSSAYIYFFYSTRYIQFSGTRMDYAKGLQYYDSGRATIHVLGFRLRKDKGIPQDTLSTSHVFDKTPLTSQIIAYRALQNFVYFFGLTIISVFAILIAVLVLDIRKGFSSKDDAEAS